MAIFCAAAAATIGVSGLDRKVDTGKIGGAARSKILGTSGQDSDRHGAEVEWPEGGKSGLERELSLAEGGKREAGRGILFG